MLILVQIGTTQVLKLKCTLMGVQATSKHRRSLSQPSRESGETQAPGLKSTELSLFWEAEKSLGTYKIV